MQTNRSYRLRLMGLLVLVLGVGCCTPNSSVLTVPTLVSTTPLAATNTACPATTVSAVFSKALNPATVNSSSFILTGTGQAPVAGQVTYSDSTDTALFTPSSKLVAGTTYAATVTTAVKDVFGNSLASNSTWSFTTASNGCNPPPMVSNVSPAVGSLTACPSSAVSVTFNEAMNASSINTTTFTLATQSGVPVAGQVVYTAATNTAIFTPSASLTAGATYSAMVGTGVQDLFGNSLAARYMFTFSTAANGCHPAPMILSIAPAASATGVCPNTPVVATFSEAMNPATVTASSFMLSPGVVGTVSHDATNTVYTLTPSSSLALNATYTVNLATSIQDTYGNPLPTPGMSSFTTAANGCHPPPLVTNVVAANGATGVCPNKVVTATFNSAMNPSTLNGATFTVSAAGAAIAGQVTYDAASNTATFTPAASLPLSTTITATITTGAQDTFGNGLTANYTWTFATGANTCLPAAPPATVTPVNGATGLCPLTSVAATFTQAMNPVTINSSTFKLTGPGNVAVAGVVSADATNRIFTFKPSSPLALSTTYTATITTGAQDTFGNPLASNYTWTFTTGASTCAATVPVVVTVSPAANAVGVCANSIVTATFNEAMNPVTINTASFTLSNGVTGTVSLDGSGTIAAFMPATALALNTLYTAMITTGAKDLNGNPLATNYTWSFTTANLACQMPVPLGTAANFEILAAATITNTGPTVITGGDLGLSPGTSITGFPLGILTAPAAMQVTNQTAAQGALDLTIAYNYAAGLAGGAALPANLSGLTLTPGLYKNATAVTLSGGNLILDAQGNANAVFIFQIGTTLTTLGGTQVVLVNGAQARNVFWQVGSSATLGTTSVFKGTILALQSITLQTGASLEGRALARIGAVTLDANAVTAP